MRILIMSLGSIGQRHLRNLRALLPQAQIALWRRAEMRGTADTPGADHTFFSLQEVLAFAPQAALICSPASGHLEAALALAEAGVHLLVEKPLAHTAQGVQQLIDVCVRKKLVLMVGYNLHFMPSLRHAKAMLDAGQIGSLLSARAEVGQYLPDWRPASDYRQSVTARAQLGGGVLLELSHDIDYLTWIMGMPSRLAAFGGTYSDLEIDVEDTAEIMLEYEAPRRLASIHLDMVQRAPVRRCRFVGSEGVLVWDCIADRIELFTASTRQWQVMDEFKLEDRNMMYIDQLRHFLDCIASGQPPENPGTSGLGVLRIVEAARLSMRTGTSVSPGGSAQS